MLVGDEEGQTLAQKGAELILDWQDIWQNIEIALLRLKPKEVEYKDPETGIPMKIKTNIYEEDPTARPLVTKEGLNILYSTLISIVNKNTFLGNLRRDEAMKMFMQIVDRIIEVMISNYDKILYPEGEEYEEIELLDDSSSQETYLLPRKKVNPANINLVIHIISENIYMALNRAIAGHTSETIRTIQKIEERITERENNEDRKRRFPFMR